MKGMPEKIIDQIAFAQGCGGETIHLRSLQVAKYLTAVRPYLEVSQTEQCLRCAKGHVYVSRARPYLHEAIQED